MSNLDQTVAGCRNRQRRVLELMRRERLDLVIVARHEHVQWLAGPRFHFSFEPAAALASDGHVTLVAPAVTHKDVAADEVLAYPSNQFSTLRNDQRQASSEVLLAALAKRARPRRVGVEFSSFSPHLSTRLDVELVDIEPELYRL